MCGKAPKNPKALCLPQNSKMSEGCGVRQVKQVRPVERLVNFGVLVPLDSTSRLFSTSRRDLDIFPCIRLSAWVRLVKHFQLVEEPF